MPATIPTGEHRDGSKNPRITMRKEEFYQLTRIQRRLDKQPKTVEFDDDQLEEVFTVRGSPFDIDENDPIDLDPRYFLPGPVENMEYGIEAIQKAAGLMRELWPQSEPIKHHRLRDGDEIEYEVAARYALRDAQARADFCEKAAREASGWIRHEFMPNEKKPWCQESWPSPDDGHPYWQQWESGLYYMWPRPPGNYPFKRGAPRYNRDVPHAFGTAYDMARPLRGGVLRSELSMAVSLLKAQIRWPDMYVDHEVYPALVVSFHGRFSARVIQAYFQNGRMVLRLSRLVDLYTRVISPEVRLITRWLNSKPIGDTRLPVSEEKPRDNNASSPIEVPDTPIVLSPTIEFMASQAFRTGIFVVLLLHGVCMPLLQGPRHQPYDWTILHKQFCVLQHDPDNRAKSRRVLTAKTVGCLQVKHQGGTADQGDTLAIIEVKPYRRMKPDANATAVRTQEGAEMASWIATEAKRGLLPPRITASGGMVYRRILIAQDFDEIFVTIAEFDDLYVRYITGNNNQPLSSAAPHVHHFCLSNFNLVPTDFFHVDSPDSATKPVAILARLGRGPAYVDHHIFMSTNETSHVYHCSFEAHDHDTQMLGHQRLAGRGKYKPVSGAYPPATDL
ncbi:hypothetical protein ACJ41O_000358 [Fusarium nematophilum]